MTMASHVRFEGDNSGFQLGNNYGNIHIQARPERPETPPEPLSTVPFDRDPDFVTCGSILDDIDDKCSSPASRIIALCGLGGVGKSQLAIEYCYRVRERSLGTWVLWVHASNAARLELSYREIADRLKIFGRKDPQASVFQLLHDWLHESKRGRWILILDNLDDESLLSESVQAHSQNSALRKPFRGLLPRCSHGTIILTTRHMKVARMMAKESDILGITPMDEKFASTLMKQKLTVGTTEKEIKEIVETLEFMPLAIVHAASYMEHQYPPWSVAKYLKVFRKSHRRLLVDHEAEHMHHRRDTSASNSILVTWQISFDYIRQSHRSAANLLSLMSFFDRQGIPRKFLQDQRRNSPPDLQTTRPSHSDSEESATESDEDLDFNSDLLTLRDFSFISINHDGAEETIEMHRLVQFALINWLEIHEEIEHWKSRFIRILCSAFPDEVSTHEESYGWKKAQKLFPHVKSAMLQRPKSDEDLLRWASLLFNASLHAWDGGKIADMKQLVLNAKEARETLLGPEHMSTLKSSKILALAYTLQGRFPKAEVLQTHLVENIKTGLGGDNEMMIDAMNDLALTYKAQGRLQEAAELQWQVMEKSKKLFPEDHPNSIAALANLAATCNKMGDYQHAEILGDTSVRIFVPKLGLHHPNTMACMGNLASTYISQNRFDEAKVLLEPVLGFSQRFYGVNSPNCFPAMNSLATLHQEQGQWEEAEKLYMQILTSPEAHGEEHPDTLTVLSNLAALYRSVNNYAKSVELHEQVANVRKRVLGEEHLDTCESQGCLAQAYGDQGRWKDAEQAQISCLQGVKSALGEDDPRTVHAINHLAKIFEHQGRMHDIFAYVKDVSNVTMPYLTRIPIQALTPSGEQRPSERYHPAQPRDIFEVFSILCQCGHGGLPRSIILQILDHARYWLLHRAWRKGFLRVTENECQEKTPYLATTLVHGSKHPVQMIKFRIISYEHGHASHPESHDTSEISGTWFDLNIEPGPQQGPDRISRQRHLMTNLYARLGFALHIISFPSLSTQWVRNLQAGDRISVVPMARYPGWANHVEGVCIEVYTSCLLAQPITESPCAGGMEVCH
ncbi:hypothetical protein N7470_004769 [Penicillium chermesinum]|nr:hypothetical protein N7470_004769 [Penicillium chermesinum]